MRTLANEGGYNLNIDTSKLKKTYWRKSVLKCERELKAVDENTML